MPKTITAEQGLSALKDLSALLHDLHGKHKINNISLERSGFALSTIRTVITNSMAVTAPVQSSASASIQVSREIVTKTVRTAESLGNSAQVVDARRRSEMNASRGIGNGTKASDSAQTPTDSPRSKGSIWPSKIPVETNSNTRVICSVNGSERVSLKALNNHLARLKLDNFPSFAKQIEFVYSEDRGELTLSLTVNHFSSKNSGMAALMKEKNRRIDEVVAVLLEEARKKGEELSIPILQRS